MPAQSLTRALLIFGFGLTVLVVGLLAWQLTDRSGAGGAGVQSSGTALIGGPFELTDHNGETRRYADFEGRYPLIFFGYTHCPDFCPAALLVMTEALDQLGETAPEKVAQIAPLFVTVDPERDTVEALKAYSEHFHESLLGLTGTLDQVAEAAKAFRVFYRKAESEDASDYLMDHSTYVYLMGPDGKYVTHFGHDQTSEQMAEKLGELVKG